MIGRTANAFLRVMLLIRCSKSLRLEDDSSFHVVIFKLLRKITKN